MTLGLRPQENWAGQIPRPYSRADEDARSLYGHFGMTNGEDVVDRFLAGSG